MEDKNVTDARETAEAWLELTDTGDYAASWEKAAVLFRNAISAADLNKQLSAVRKPLGEVVTRSGASAQYATSLPGAPDGEYVVIQFNTSFSRKKTAVETVTPMKEEDGCWRVSGYYIR